MYGVRERERCVWSEGESCVYGVREREGISEIRLQNTCKCPSAMA